MNPILRSVLEKFVTDAEKEIAKIDKLLNATPLSDMIALERETLERIKSMSHAEVQVLVEDAIKKRKKLMRQAKQQVDAGKMTDRLVDLRYAIEEAANLLRYS